MTGQGAGVAGAVIGNRRAIVLTHHVDVKIHQTLAGYPRRNRAHAMSCVARGTREAVLRNVISVMSETEIIHHIAQVMAFGTHSIGSVEAEVGIWKRIRHRAARSCSLAELVVVLENVRIHRTMRAVRSESAKLAIVVAVMTVAAQNPYSHQAPCGAVLIQHVGEQARLGQWTQTVMSDRMAGSRRRAELGNYV